MKPCEQGVGRTRQRWRKAYRCCKAYRCRRAYTRFICVSLCLLSGQIMRINEFNPLFHHVHALDYVKVMSPDCIRERAILNHQLLHRNHRLSPHTSFPIASGRCGNRQTVLHFTGVDPTKRRSRRQRTKQSFIQIHLPTGALQNGPTRIHQRRSPGSIKIHRSNHDFIRSHHPS